jgi:hypothetical protein
VKTRFQNLPFKFNLHCYTEEKEKAEKTAAKQKEKEAKAEAKAAATAAARVRSVQTSNARRAGLKYYAYCNPMSHPHPRLFRLGLSFFTPLPTN